jgi:hypothetical protein
MAKANQESPAAATPLETKKSAIPAEYTASEFAEAARNTFGANVTPDCVIAAFRVAGITKATKEKAQEIVSKFLKKEVK